MLSKSTGPVLDAIFCLQRIVHLKPKGKVRAAFVTGATDNQQAAQEIAERYSTIEAADRAFSEALEAYRGELQSSNLTADDVSLFNQLAGSILFANPAMWSLYYFSALTIPYVVARVLDHQALPAAFDGMRFS